MSKLALVLSCTMVLAACAQQPASIQPVSFAGAYDEVSCARAQTLHQQEAARVPALVASQKQAVTGDAVGVLLLGVPMSSLTGADLEGEIAATKGKLLALESRLDVCGRTTTPVDWA